MYLVFNHVPSTYYLPGSGMIGGNTYHTSLHRVLYTSIDLRYMVQVYCVYKLCCSDHISGASLVYSTGMYTGMEYGPEIILVYTPGQFQQYGTI